jgi:hypothetical protein
MKDEPRCGGVLVLGNAETDEKLARTAAAQAGTMTAQEAKDYANSLLDLINFAREKSGGDDDDEKR